MNLTKKQRERRSLDAVLERIAIAPIDVDGVGRARLRVDNRRRDGRCRSYRIVPAVAARFGLAHASDRKRRTLDGRESSPASYSRGVPPQQLQVRLRPQSWTKPNRDRVAAVLCDYVASNFAAPGEVKSGEHVSNHFPRNRFTLPCLACGNPSTYGTGHGRLGELRIRRRVPGQRLQKRTPCLPITVSGVGNVGSSSWQAGTAVLRSLSGRISWHPWSLKRRFDRVFFVQGLENKVFELRLRQNLLSGTADLPTAKLTGATILVF